MVLKCDIVASHILAWWSSLWVNQHLI